LYYYKSWRIKRRQIGIYQLDFLYIHIIKCEYRYALVIGDYTKSLKIPNGGNQNL